MQRPWRASSLLAIIGLLACLILATKATADMRSEDWLPQPLSDADFHHPSMDQVKLGRLLFYDKILSGNRNIACATCHHHDHASADGLSLSVGEGGVGLGPKRSVGSGASMIKQRVPRNAPALFNLGARQFRAMFLDGRLFVDANAPGGFNSPAHDDLPLGLDTVVAAQAMFPVTSEIEMAGSFGESDLGNAAKRGHEFVWPIIAQRVRTIPAYVALFQAAFPDVSDAQDISMVLIANAIAAFEMHEWRADDSPFDRYLQGQKAALNAAQRRGMRLFYGRAGCSHCHAGTLQTDHDFHAIAMPQIGWVRTRQFDLIARDRGRINESDAVKDAYKFRTPSLRNVTATAPYGHSGAYRTLEDVIRHHLNPLAAHQGYDRRQAILPPHPRLSGLDFIVMENRRETAKLLAANELAPSILSDDEIADLLAFLEALTDQASLSGRLGKPASVPSGLALD